MLQCIDVYGWIDASPHIAVRDNTKAALAVLAASLPSKSYVVEVVTDKALGLQQYLCEEHVDNVYRFAELVVPSDYCCPTGLQMRTAEDYACPTGAKYKARALQYAMESSTALGSDWVVHLDEETRFDACSVRRCIQHCGREDSLVASNQKLYGDIGQGCLLYGERSDKIGSYVCTLADSVRTGERL